VVKKNKKILQNLENWLRDYNAGSKGEIDTSVLLIDDEADSASINTRSGDQDPTAVNERIRALLHLFSRSSYVGVTATPFANIFIDPDSENEMVGNDLFPRDFIYSLEAPTNYVGPDRVFADDSTLNVLRVIDDAEAIFSLKHKSSFVVSELPASLYEAVRSFVIANAIRDLRPRADTPVNADQRQPVLQTFKPKSHSSSTKNCERFNLTSETTVNSAREKHFTTPISRR